MSIITEKYINPLTDFGFKKLFGSEPNKNLLIDFLNELLPERHQIEDLTYTKNEHLGESDLDRSAIFDIYCTGKSNEKFIVEVQKAKQNYFKDRSVYYASFPIQEQAKKTNWNFKLTPIYTIGILDFVFDEHKADLEFVHLVELKNQNCEVFYDKLKFIYIELPKFTKTIEELETHFDKWLFILRHLAVLEHPPQKLQQTIFLQLFEIAEVAKYSKEERAAYHQSKKRYLDINNVVDTAALEGEEKGRAAGKIEGLKIVARNLKSAGMPIQEIAKNTGLSESDIEAL